MAFELAFVDSIGDIYTPVSDSFTRSVVDGFGTATTGQAWSVFGTAADFDVNGSAGTIQPSALGTTRLGLLPSGAADNDVSADFTLNALPASGTVRFGVVPRALDNSNYIRVEALVATTGVVTFRVVTVLAGSAATVATTTGITIFAGVSYRIRARMVDGQVHGKMWPTGTPEPTWALTWAGADVPAGTNVGVSMRNDTAVTTHVLTVDNFSATSPATLRLDLNDGLTGGSWRALGDGQTTFDPPELRRSFSSSMMRDGEYVSSATYANRVIVMSWDLTALAPDAWATQVQLLSRELDRASNCLRYKPDTSQPVWFRTFRSDYTSVTWDGVLKRLTAQVLAEPFAYGRREVFGPFTVTNDPEGAPGATINANPFFETDASDWSPNGGTSTFVRSTAQFHEGAASGLLTPDGVTANVDARTTSYPAAPGVPYRASSWVRCAVARNVRMILTFRDVAGNILTSVIETYALAATTWTFVDVAAHNPPVQTAQVQIQIQMTGTPPANNTLHVDEAKLWRVAVGGDSGSMCFDTPTIKGDVPAPLSLIDSPGVLSGGANPDSNRFMSHFATRRRGDPTATPFFVQAEAMTMGTDTTVQAKNAAFSGAGSNFARCTFTTSPTVMASRLSTTYPQIPTDDARGTYRVYVRVRKSAAGSGPMNMRLRWGSVDGTTATVYTNTTVSIGADAGPSAPSFRHVDLGWVTIPPLAPTEDPGGRPIPPEGIFVSVDAQRDSGTGSLDFDDVLFVPADDQTLLVKWPGTASTPTDVVYDTTGRSGPAAAAVQTVYARTAAGLTRALMPAEPRGGPLEVSPGAPNRVWFVKDVGIDNPANAAGDDKTATVTVIGLYHPQYLHLRPATT